MNEQKDRARFHRAIDRTLSGLPEDPFLASRIAAQTAQSGEGEKMRKCKYIMMTALIVVLSLCTVAVASEVLRGTVDWDGNMIAEDDPLSTPEPAPISTEELDLARRKALFKEKQQPQNGETVIIYNLDTREEEWSDVTFSTRDESEFRALLAASGMRLPDRAPEGYVFSSGYIAYACKPGGEYQLVDYADSGEGYLAVTYCLAEEDRLPVQYNMLYVKENPEEPQNSPYLSVWAMKQDFAENMGQGVWNAQTVQTVNIPGMEKALCVVDAHATHLTMYEKLPEMESYLSVHHNGLEAVYSVFYSVDGPVTESELIAMFDGK